MAKTTHLEKVNILKTAKQTVKTDPGNSTGSVASVLDRDRL